MCGGVYLSIKYPINAQSGLVIILIVTLFIKLHITVQSSPVILAILCICVFVYF